MIADSGPVGLPTEYGSWCSEHVSLRGIWDEDEELMALVPAGQLVAVLEEMISEEEDGESDA